MRVSRWGNSLAVRLPAAAVEALNLEEGDEIAVELADARTFAIAKSPSRADLIERLRKYRGRLPADFTFDRLKANERR